MSDLNYQITIDHNNEVQFFNINIEEINCLQSQSLEGNDACKAYLIVNVCQFCYQSVFVILLFP